MDFLSATQVYFQARGIDWLDFEALKMALLYLYDWRPCSASDLRDSGVLSGFRFVGKGISPIGLLN